jgi:hypothetical protein
MEAGDVNLESRAIEAPRQLDHLALGTSRQELREEQRDGERRRRHAHLDLSKRGARTFAQKRPQITTGNRGWLSRGKLRA